MKSLMNSLATLITLNSIALLTMTCNVQPVSAAENVTGLNMTGVAVFNETSQIGTITQKGPMKWEWHETKDGQDKRYSWTEERRTATSVFLNDGNSIIELNIPKQGVFGSNRNFTTGDKYWVLKNFVASEENSEEKMIDLVNQLRRSKGLSVLTQNEKLMQASRNWSKYLIENNTFAHVVGESTPGSRATAAGYTGFVRMENLAGGGDAQNAFELLKKSPLHYENMIIPELKEIGVGEYSANGKRYWTMMGGTR
ncbi:Cysteine-rich secretory protein family protein [Rubinisphaera italica]|uniref:Cysteine-rich secretory protein family protein n=2 Tax=Rubinisphaera italica TaxID=2527969 RepID=A0A5C5XFY7_9PLAN|nr:Cysteine-rich secretory protein family protein [Rubinisphaera italica]